MEGNEMEKKELRHSKDREIKKNELGERARYESKSEEEGRLVAKQVIEGVYLHRHEQKGEDEWREVKGRGRNMRSTDTLDRYFHRSTSRKRTRSTDDPQDNDNGWTKTKGEKEKRFREVKKKMCRVKFFDIKNETFFCR